MFWKMNQHFLARLPSDESTRNVNQVQIVKFDLNISNFDDIESGFIN